MTPAWSVPANVHPPRISVLLTAPQSVIAGPRRCSPTEDGTLHDQRLEALLRAHLTADLAARRLGVSQEYIQCCGQPGLVSVVRTHSGACTTLSRLRCSAARAPQRRRHPRDPPPGTDGTDAPGEGHSQRGTEPGAQAESVEDSRSTSGVSLVKPGQCVEVYTWLIGRALP